MGSTPFFGGDVSGDRSLGFCPSPLPPLALKYVTSIDSVDTPVYMSKLTLRTWKMAVFRESF